MTPFAPWLLFAMLALLEASPIGQRLYRHRAREVEGLTAWVRKQPRPLLWALIITATSTASLAGGLMLVWLAFYLFAAPLSLHWPGVVGLSRAAAEGWPALLLNGGVRLLALLVFYAVVVAPGLNGGPRWVRGTRVPRMAGAGVVVCMLAVAAGTQTGGVLAAWAAVVAFAAFSACDLTQAGLMLLLFMRALGSQAGG